MRKNPLNTLLNTLSLAAVLLAIASFPLVARAQLVGDTPPSQQLTDSTAADHSAQPAAKPAGKKRLAKDFTLNGDSLWTDTAIDLQPGEHVVITAKGTIRYAD